MYIRSFLVKLVRHSLTSEKDPEPILYIMFSHFPSHNGSLGWPLLSCYIKNKVLLNPSFR
jgi:hypothetical protein